MAEWAEQHRHELMLRVPSAGVVSPGVRLPCVQADGVAPAGSLAEDAGGWSLVWYRRKESWPLACMLIWTGVVRLLGSRCSPGK